MLLMYAGSAVREGGALFEDAGPRGPRREAEVELQIFEKMVDGQRAARSDLIYHKRNSWVGSRPT